MDSCCFENAEKQVVPEPFDLHIFTGNHAKVQQHIAAHRQLDEMPGIPFPGGKQCRSKPKAGSDVAEIQQIEKLSFVSHSVTATASNSRNSSIDGTYL